MNGNLTYRQLLSELTILNKEHLNDHVTIYRADTGEFFELAAIQQAAPGNEADGVLDEGHAYLVDNSLEK